ncbi:MMPL family transporter [Paenibacillus sp. GCM10012307]|uniref:MMPL family transporter n=1 Tax=Paenibacillus roseus TaxID=2798579 RepID=A0A934J874_9BACL|nr:MMPL family transporter [Paenibacillus roseus]MBJ6362496.1 MMPL family transporter [Paenibacillus roseus]
MFKALGSLAAKYPKIVISVWIAILLGSVFLGPKLEEQLSISAFNNMDSESTDARADIKTQFNGQYPQKLILLVESGNIQPSDPAFKQYILSLEEEMKKNPAVGTIESAFSSDNPALLIADTNAAIINVNMTSDDSTTMRYVEVIKRDIIPRLPDSNGFTVQITGAPGIAYDLNTIGKQNVTKVESIALPIVFLLLVIVFRSLVAAFIPLIIGIFTILVATAGAYLVAVNMPLYILITNIITMLGLGVAIDYALFVTQRFREELSIHSDKRVAAVNAIGTTGRSVFFAGITVAISLFSLLVPNSMLARSIAVGGILVTVVSLLLALTLLPAMLVLLGKKIDLLKIKLPNWKKQTTNQNAFVKKLMTNPVVFLLIGIVLTGIFAPAVFDIEIHEPAGAYTELPVSSEARQAMEKIVDHAGVGNIFPIQILIRNEDRTMYEKESLAELERISQSIGQLDHIENVISLTTINGANAATTDQLYDLYIQRDAFPSDTQQQLQTLVSKDERASIVYVIPEASPGSPETRELVHRLRDDISRQMSPGYTMNVTGETAIGLDFDAQFIRNIPMILAISIFLTFVLLLITFRSVILPIKAIVLNLLVTVNTLGFLVLMFQYANIPGTHEAPLNINTPVIVFALLFGLSIDYEVMLVSRIKEHFDKSGNNEAAIVEGYSKTSGMINGAAAIMITVFGAFYFADLQIVREIGVGLALAIFIDAAIVRTIVVPTSMKLLGRLNWWFPKFRQGQK